MRDVVRLSEKEYASEIYDLLLYGKVEQTIMMCQEAIAEYPDSNFFYRICGDAYYEMKEYDKALDKYMMFLERISQQPEFFNYFARFFRKLNQVYCINDKIYNKLAGIVGEDQYAYTIRTGLVKLLLDTYQVPKDVEKAISDVIGGKVQIDVIKKNYADISEMGKCCEIIYLCRSSERNYLKRNNSINRYFLKRLEQNKLYEYAIVAAQKILLYNTDAVVIRTLFRICRLCDNYDAAEAYLRENDIETKAEFNIQYELVLYYDAVGNEKKRNDALKRIETLSKDRLPISRTLFKLYVKYDMLDKAKQIQKSIMSSQDMEGLDKAKEETEAVVWERLRTLVSEQEHTRQLLAMSELIKGFSHELGQPITNIRYAIQLYFRRNRKLEINISNEEKELLDSILRQTERVGKLLNRFSPLISSKSEKRYFSIREAINNVFDELAVRLQGEDIEFEIRGEEVEIYGEELQFGQVFYNLIINSIYAIQRTEKKGFLDVNIKKERHHIKIEFSDNGIGIPKENQKKIFNPFFSTKNKEIEEGGEGLGLFIVWNILKIFSGKIYVDEKYNKGARFVIEIDIKENRNV